MLKLLCKLLLGILIFGSLANAANANSNASKLRELLYRVGYQGVHISDCGLSFSRTVKKIQENQSLFAYRRYVDVSTLSKLDELSVNEVVSGADKYYQIVARHNEQYFSSYRQMFPFRVWVLETYPNTSWPFLWTSGEEHLIPEIEFELYSRVPDVLSLNRWVSFTKSGSITYVPEVFEFSHSQRGEVELFLELIIELSRTCTN